MDSDGESNNRDQPPQPQSEAEGKPHTCVDGTESDNGGGNDGVVQLELARRTERSARLTMIATVAIALGTLALAGATFHLASSTSDVADQTKRVADRTQDLARATENLVILAKEQGSDTKAAIQAASRQATAAEEANKVSRDPNVSISQILVPAPTITTKYKASFGVFDYGRTPAYHVQGRAVAVILAEPAMPTPLSACNIFGCGDAVLFPDNGFQGSGLSFPSPSLDITSETLADLQAKRKTLYLIGRVDYFDQTKTRRFIAICYFYKPDENTSGPCNGGNDAN